MKHHKLILIDTEYMQTLMVNSEEKDSKTISPGLDPNVLDWLLDDSPRQCFIFTDTR